MNLPYQYLYAYIDAPVEGRLLDNASPGVIGDFDTREPPRMEEGDAIVLSLI